MNGKRKISMVLLLLSLVFVALPAGAVSIDSVWTLNRFNTGGTSFAILPTNANHFCYLSTVGVRETDTGGELAMCRVRRSGAVWVLEAILGTSSDADVYCTSYCYNN